ncbi:MAG: UDP-N-acetylmuramate--L-alanine ligase [Bacteroidales bacterium]|jgi:UDP-N-acetylmuramate--alanine ligase|nr:UDP-N-acetylmuramate--L-alanine ligase [Bacteroidales bacterium]
MENKITSVYFLGIGGIGMSALAHYYKEQGAKVSGYDLTESPITQYLQNLGIDVVFEDDISLLPEKIDMVIYTPAIPQDSKQLNELKNRNIPLFKRSQVLGEVTKNHKTIAISGTHGKTTTTAIISNVYHNSKQGVNAFIGGVSLNFDSNYLFTSKNSPFVVEADEYDKSFLTLFPDIAVVTSMEADHLDIYNDANNLKDTFHEFFSQIKPNGTLVYKYGLEVKVSNIQAVSYSIESSEADVFASNIRIEDGSFHFDIYYKKENLGSFIFSFPGRHNLENAVAGIAVALVDGLSVADLKKGIGSFKGVKRRFEKILETENLLLIDDYAHHPTEVEAFLESIRKQYPGRKITTIFQPHLYSRTQHFMDEFAEVLGKTDRLILFDIYPARELPIDGINSTNLLKKVKLENKEMANFKNIIDVLESQSIDIVVVMGAGNIDRIVPQLKNHFETV